MSLQSEIEKLHEWWLTAAGDKLVESLRRNKVTFSGGSDSQLAGSIEISKKQVLMFDYWEYVDQGRRPGPVSEQGYENIKRWVKRKGEKKLADKFGIKDKDFKKRVEKTAYLVRRKVSKEGYEGTYFVEEAITQQFVDELAQLEADLIAEYITKDINGN